FPSIAGAEGWMNLTQAAAWLGVTAKELRVAAERGHVDAIHPPDDGPWLFNRSVLEAEAAQRLIERVRERRTPAGHPIQQAGLFESTT
ncbi:MAG: recombinase family protein, partial [Rhodoplanes sp.]